MPAGFSFSSSSSCPSRCNLLVFKMPQTGSCSCSPASLPKCPWEDHPCLQQIDARSAISTTSHPTCHAQQHQGFHGQSSRTSTAGGAKCYATHILDNSHAGLPTWSSALLLSSSCTNSTSTQRTSTTLVRQLISSNTSRGDIWMRNPVTESNVPGLETV